MAILPEEINVKGLEKYFKKHKLWYMKTMGNGFTRSGVPDIILNYKGMFIGLEVKKHRGGKASHLQMANRDWINRTGGICWIVDDFEETIKQLEGL